jgi:clorobiocin/coumermycin A biosynthesis protein CloN6/CouN6
MSMEAMMRDGSDSARPSHSPAAHPNVSADLLLMHAPAFYDFRDRSDIYFPYLSTSGDVPITPLYEYFPLGFKTLHRYLSERQHTVRIVNLATVLLRYPAIDLRSFLGSMDVKLFGIDLHWMVHVQGSLSIAKLLKSIHPDVPVIFGGISSTYYARQLIEYPFVDMVMRGYDTHEPMHGLLTKLKMHLALTGVPNLLWKDRSGEVVDNGFSHTPDTFSCGIDWSQIPHGSPRQSLPILEIVSTQTAGCAHNCGWCGGSSDAFRRIFNRKPTISRKQLCEVDYEFRTMASISDREKYHLYSVGSYNEPRNRMTFFVKRVAESNFRSISYEQFHLTSADVLREMAKANARTTITLSPESHDMNIARLAGRGVYSPEQMERWIHKALDAGIFEIDIWYFVGMPEQNEASVRATVDYCHRLLRMFKGKRVFPFICPMIPFLDPASTFFEYPKQHGYRVFFRTVEEHRRGMENASLVNRVNYETRWLNRFELVRVGYNAVRRLTEIKGEMGLLPSGITTSIIQKIDDAFGFIKTVHAIDCIEDPAARKTELGKVGGEIRERNRMIFFAGVANQAFPINREVGGRWFDEVLYDPRVLEAAESGWLKEGAVDESQRRV